MENTNFIGIDVSKLNLHIYQLNCKKYTIIKNDCKEIENFFKKLEANIFVVYEPTGVYGKKLEKTLNELELTHFQVHPNDMHHLAKTLFSFNKNDKVDCEHIAQIAQLLYIQSNELHAKNKFITPSSNTINQINHYMTQIRFMKGEIRRLKNNMEVLNESPFESTLAMKGSQDAIVYFENMIAQIEEEVEKILGSSGNKKSLENLKTIPGFGPKIALEVLVFFLNLQSKGFKKEDSKKVIAYSGLNPIQASSGTSLNTQKISKRGNKNVRKSIYMAGMQWSKMSENEKYKNTNIAKFTTRMKNKFASKTNKRGKSVACAVSKKLLQIARAIFCNDTEYNFV